MSPLAAKIRAGRESWLELDKPNRRALKIRRLYESELPKIRGGLTIDDCCAVIVDWRGFTEADLLGPSVGAADLVPFDRDACDEMVRDDAELVGSVSGHLIEQIRVFMAERGVVEKNSSPD